MRRVFILILIILAALLLISCGQETYTENLVTVDSTEFKTSSETKYKVYYFGRRGFSVDFMTPITDEEKRFDFFHVNKGAESYLCEKGYESIEHKFQCHQIENVHIKTK